jgi:hypothetical protein
VTGVEAEVTLSTTHSGANLTFRVQVITMTTLWRWMVLVVVLAVPALTVRGADDKKKPDTQSEGTATGADIAALEAAHEAIGTINKVDAAKQTLLLHIEFQTLQSTGKAGVPHSNTNVQHMLHQQEQIMRTRNPVQRAHLMQSLMQEAMRNQLHNQPNVKVVTEKVDYELQGNSDTKLRMMELPPKTGPDGKPQQYSYKEKEDARSPDPSLIGYHADWDKLAVGMTVKVILSTAKAGDKTDTVPVKMIIIQPDPPPAKPMPDTKKDNK